MADSYRAGQSLAASAGGTPATAGAAGYPAASASASASGIRGRSETRERVGAVIIDKNRAVAKRLARVLVSAGYTVKSYDEGSQLGSALAAEPGVDSWLLVGDAQSQAAVLGVVSGQRPGTPPLRAVFYGQDGELDHSGLIEQPGVVALLGCRGGERRELESELLSVASFLRGQPLLPLQAFLLWGAAAYSTHIGNIAARDAAESRIVKLCSEQLNVGSRIANSVAEVVHELLTNAMYDAPVDDQGRPMYNHDRTAPIQLSQNDRVVFRYGTDGLRLVVEAHDRFGRLRRGDVARSFRRAASGQLNRGEGGAGIGLSVIFRAAQTLQIDVEPGVRTRVTVVFELEPARAASGASAAEAGRPGRSLIFPDLTAVSGRRD